MSVDYRANIDAAAQPFEARLNGIPLIIEPPGWTRGGEQLKLYVWPPTGDEQKEIGKYEAGPERFTAALMVRAKDEHRERLFGPTPLPRELVLECVRRWDPEDVAGIYLEMIRSDRSPKDVEGESKATPS